MGSLNLKNPEAQIRAWAKRPPTPKALTTTALDRSPFCHCILLTHRSYMWQKREAATVVSEFVNA